jgi:hypothetical protein
VHQSNLRGQPFESQAILYESKEYVSGPIISKYHLTLWAPHLPRCKGVTCSEGRRKAEGSEETDEMEIDRLYFIGDINLSVATAS